MHWLIKCCQKKKKIMCSCNWLTKLVANVRPVGRMSLGPWNTVHSQWAAICGAKANVFKKKRQKLPLGVQLVAVPQTDNCLISAVKQLIASKIKVCVYISVCTVYIYYVYKYTHMHACIYLYIILIIWISIYTCKYMNIFSKYILYVCVFKHT